LAATSNRDIKPSRGRPRDVERDELILTTARRLLAEQGFDALSFEAISRETGVARQTIYRRWPTKAHLASEIAYGGNRGLPDLVAEGDLRAQVRALVQQIVDQYRRAEVGAATVGLIPAFRRDEKLRPALHAPVEATTRKRLAGIIEDAQRAGIMRAGVDPDILFDMIVGTSVFRLLFSSSPMPDAFVDELTDHLCLGLRPDGLKG
jgi:AcrR family transcriptional regulator